MLPRPGVPRRGHCRPIFQHGFWPFSRVLHRQSGVVLAAAILFCFTVVPFVVCRERRAIFLRGAVYDCRKSHYFSRASSSGAHHVVAKPKHTQGIGRGVRNFDSAVGDREKQNAVLSGTYAKFTQNPATKNHLLSSDNKLLVEACPLGSVWGIGLRADDPRANNPCQLKETICSVRHLLPFAKLFATVKQGRRTRPPLVGSAPALRMQES